jgi:hypothetical protein
MAFFEQILVKTDTSRPVHGLQFSTGTWQHWPLYDLAPYPSLSHTVRKMGLILCSIERILKMQFSMARKFTFQLLRRYEVKPPKKPHTSNLPLDIPCLEQNKQHRWGSIQRSLDIQSVPLSLRHSYTC